MNKESRVLEGPSYWQSDLSIEQVFSEQASFSYPAVYQHDFLYLTDLPGQKRRSVLMRCQSGQAPQCLTPEPFSVGNKINEYGGKPYWLINETIYFVNQVDQSLYRQALNQPTSLTCITPQLTDGQTARFTDLHAVNEHTLLAIVETAAPSESENGMCLAVLSHGLGDSKLSKLVEGADFYSNLVLNAQQTRAAWVQWQHPAMPWDETQLWLADVVIKGNQVCFENQQQVGLPPTVSVCQLAFADNGQLYFSVDFANVGDASEQYWHVYCVDPDQVDSIIPVTGEQTTIKNQEFGYPHWQYGDHRIVRLDKQRLLVIGSQPRCDTLYCIDTDSQELTTVSLDKQYVGLQSLQSDGEGNAVVITFLLDAPPCLLRINMAGSGQLDVEIVKQNPLPLRSSEISTGEHISFITRDGEQAYGFFYEPKNTAYQYASNQLPPLIVLVHGGPTARSYPWFDIQKQFWTSRGFALFDVNHRGSSGYGRAFRDALYGQWGVTDVNDVIDGIQYLIKQNKVNPNKISIRGKSAGGYTVLRALTEYPEMFKAGASYYGIGNLVTLAEHTHKFEKYYTDRLIGERFTPQTAAADDSLFKQRSPIHAVNRIGSAMILFQGLDDNVVPACVSREVVGVLNDSNVPHDYIEYEGEGHGFRQTKTKVDALSRELAFYRKVLV